MRIGVSLSIRRLFAQLRRPRSELVLPIRAAKRSDATWNRLAVYREKVEIRLRGYSQFLPLPSSHPSFKGRFAPSHALGEFESPQPSHGASRYIVHVATVGRPRASHARLDRPSIGPQDSCRGGASDQAGHLDLA